MIRREVANPNNQMRELHFAIHARPPAASRGAGVTLDGAEYSTIRIEAGEAALLGCTFDAAAAELTAWPMSFCEPDGSFVWVAERNATPRWQLDGQLFDAGPGLLYVELRGSCPAAEFDRLLTLFGWPRVPLVFQLIEAGVVLDEEEFRRFAQ